MLNALPYVENEEYFHEGGGRFFAQNGSSVRFEGDANGLVEALVMDGVFGVNGSSRKCFFLRDKTNVST